MEANSGFEFLPKSKKKIGFWTKSGFEINNEYKDAVKKNH